MGRLPRRIWDRIGVAISADVTPKVDLSKGIKVYACPRGVDCWGWLHIIKKLGDARLFLPSGEKNKDL